MAGKGEKVEQQQQQIWKRNGRITEGNETATAGKCLNEVSPRNFSTNSAGAKLLQHFYKVFLWKQQIKPNRLAISLIELKGFFGVVLSRHKDLHWSFIELSLEVSLLHPIFIISLLFWFKLDLDTPYLGVNRRNSLHFNIEYSLMSFSPFNGRILQRDFLC